MADVEGGSVLALAAAGEGLTIAPGVEAVIGIDNEGIRGRFLYVESGQLTVSPMVDSPIWLEGAAQGGPASIAPASREVELHSGGLMFLRVVALDDLVPGATITIAHPGPEPAVTRGSMPTPASRSPADPRASPTTRASPRRTTPRILMRPSRPT